MITEEYLKDNFLTAYFIDNARQNIEVQTTTPDKKSVFTTIIPYEENGSQYKALSKFMSLDQLHESTYQKRTQERKGFEDQVMRIAQKEGLVLDKNKLDTKFYPTILNALFTDIENVDHIFALKLAFFEMDAISSSKNDEAKKQLRQSKTKLDVINSALAIISSK